MHTVTGYMEGDPFHLQVARVEGKVLGVECAIQYLQLARKALQDGIELKLTSGWRSNTAQTKLYEARRDPAVRARLGGAARPGHSRHQSGHAVDIRTGLSKQGFLDGERTESFLFLDHWAPRFGFQRTVRDEPWHWELVMSPMSTALLAEAA